MPRTTRQAIEAPKKCKAITTRNSPRTPCKHNAKIDGYCIQHYHVHCVPSVGINKRVPEHISHNRAPRPRTVRGTTPTVSRVANTTRQNTPARCDDLELTLSSDSDDNSSNIDDYDDNHDVSAAPAEESDEIVEYVDETSDDPLNTLADNVAAARRQLDKIEEIVSDIRKIMKFSKELAHPPAVLAASIEQSRGGLSNDIRELQRTVALMQ